MRHETDRASRLLIIAILGLLTILIALAAVNTSNNQPSDEIKISTQVLASEEAVTTTEVLTIEEQVTELSTEETVTFQTLTQEYVEARKIVGVHPTPVIPVTEETTALYAGTYYTEQDAIDLAKVLWKECGSVNSKTEQACVAWTVLNWVDIDCISVSKEVRKPNRFAFYESTKVDAEMLDLAHDVLDRWVREKNGETDVGRVLPKDYLYFEGHGGHNHFRNAYKQPYDVWDYSLPSPYNS